MSELPGVFIPASGSLGVLATMRDLGRSGVATTCLRHPWTSALRPSRFRTGPGVPMAASLPLHGKFAALLRAGEKDRGRVLLPSPDDLAWLVAERQSELASLYRLYYPAGDVMYTVLNKDRLRTVAEAHGVKSPPSWFPGDGAEAEKMARLVGGPLVVKPRTHVGIAAWTKGARTLSADEMPEVYGRVVAGMRYDRVILEHDPDAGLPFLQRYYAGAGSSIYNLIGFTDESGRLATFAATRKVLQYPRTLGVGVCFEAAPVERELAARMAEMLRAIGFFGMFEAEFVDADGELLLIDFNPRLFQSVGFVMGRGLRLPFAWYLAAMGDRARLEEELARARPFEDGSGQPSRWVHRFGLETMVAARLATFRMTPGEAKRWLSWVVDDRGRTMDAAWAADDPWPSRLNGIQTLAMFAGDPRYFFGTFVRD